jgi:hypothetical protein
VQNTYFLALRLFQIAEATSSCIRFEIADAAIFVAFV